jgi:murein DD-endopeptidase MepM/ murein hydrolase activator NlpD
MSSSASVTRAAAVTALGLVLALIALPGARAEDPVGEWPLRPEPTVVAPFDAPATPYAAGHRGVDLLGDVGQQVLAALPGTVSHAAPLAGRGVVVVTHGATRTTYQPVTASVEVGDLVAAGDPIGRLEVGGSHCLPRACLHWGWIEGETYLDPLRLVGAGPIRLLPLWRDMPASAPPSELSTVSPALRSAYASWRPLLRLLHPFGAA